MRRTVTSLSARQPSRRRHAVIGARSVHYAIDVITMPTLLISPFLAQRHLRHEIPAPHGRCMRRARPALQILPRNDAMILACFTTPLPMRRAVPTARAWFERCAEEVHVDAAYRALPHAAHFLTAFSLSR